MGVSLIGRPSGRLLPRLGLAPWARESREAGANDMKGESVTQGGSLSFLSLAVWSQAESRGLIVPGLMVCKQDWVTKARNAR